MVDVIAFDLFGTVFDLNGVPRAEVKDYLAQIKRPEWAPLHLPLSWGHLPVFPDARQGLRMLRDIGLAVVTCSNAPLGLTVKLSRQHDIRWDCMVPLELNRVYKTDPRAYMTVCEVLGVEPKQVMMVTANEKFGDLEASTALGMRAQLIRGNSQIQDIPSLARTLADEILRGT